MVVDGGGGCVDNTDGVHAFDVGDFIGSDALWIGDFLHWIFVNAVGFGLGGWCCIFRCRYDVGFGYEAMWKGKKRRKEKKKKEKKKGRWRRPRPDPAWKGKENKEEEEDTNSPNPVRKKKKKGQKLRLTSD